MHITINGTSHEVSESEALYDLPEGEVELTTDALVAFWNAGTNPTVRPNDWRFDTPRRLHAGSPVQFVAREGSKLAVSLRGDLPPLETKRPAKPVSASIPEPSDGELAARAEARRFARDMERAEIVNEAFDLIVVRKPSVIEVLAAVAEPEPAPEPYAPDFTLIPDQLARFAEADETAEDFRLRLKGYWQRFGIADGQNFPGGGEPLTGDEKIQMREIDILLNSDEGREARLHDWLFAD